MKTTSNDVCHLHLTPDACALTNRQSCQTPSCQGVTMLHQWPDWCSPATEWRREEAGALHPHRQPGVIRFIFHGSSRGDRSKLMAGWGGVTQRGWQTQAAQRSMCKQPFHWSLDRRTWQRQSPGPITRKHLHQWCRLGQTEASLPWSRQLLHILIASRGWKDSPECIAGVICLCGFQFVTVLRDSILLVFCQAEPACT